MENSDRREKQNRLIDAELAHWREEHAADKIYRARMEEDYNENPKKKKNKTLFVIP